jgi:DNA polymerase-1
VFDAVKLLEKAQLPPLPVLRDYVIADAGCELVDFDFSSQEPRTFAHFEDGWLCEQYNLDPKMDVYIALMAQTKETTGIEISRKQAKTVFLGLLYGMGVGKLALGLDTSVEEAKKIKEALMRAVPSIKQITQAISRRLKEGGKIRTWGGRLYGAEKPLLINGRMVDFSYKGVNSLIQSCAADETKEALIRYNSVKKEGRLLAQVHDEILICAPKKAWRAEAKILQECMEGLELDVPMLVEGEHGFRWGSLEAI